MPIRTMMLMSMDTGVGREVPACMVTLVGLAESSFLPCAACARGWCVSCTSGHGAGTTVADFCSCRLVCSREIFASCSTGRFEHRVAQCVTRTLKRGQRIVQRGNLLLRRTAIGNLGYPQQHIVEVLPRCGRPAACLQWTRASHRHSRADSAASHPGRAKSRTNSRSSPPASRPEPSTSPGERPRARCRSGRAPVAECSKQAEWKVPGVPSALNRSGRAKSGPAGQAPQPEQRTQESWSEHAYALPSMIAAHHAVVSGDDRMTGETCACSSPGQVYFSSCRVRMLIDNGSRCSVKLSPMPGSACVAGTIRFGSAMVLVSSVAGAVMVSICPFG